VTKPRHHRLGRELVLPDRREQRRHVGQVQFAGDGHQRVGGHHPLQRQALLAHGLGDGFLALLDGALAALLVEVLPDLGARRGDWTNVSQSCEGEAVSDFEVKISMTSPLDSRDSSGTSLPFTLAPMHLCPTSVCTA
jgi:hypothetical protein